MNDTDLAEHGLTPSVYTRELNVGFSEPHHAAASRSSKSGKLPARNNSD